MSCIKGSNPFVSAKQTSHPRGGFFVAHFSMFFSIVWITTHRRQTAFGDASATANPLNATT